ncbi:hypothetical protein Pcinc_004352 [Petrolisthes cinctipes]|uniref:NACHT domain-containing protein n=1 Tax=Petrolisthes cinctipes TaxID=88211 RepID=A0AAE1L163_PETCI|nr:hypothetical protein Pcinc_004352 [Petrolisthes cinctipes]
MGSIRAMVGVRLEDHNHLKYTLAVTRVGRAVYIKVFSWGYKHGTTHIKDALYTVTNYSTTQFKKDFNTTQRKKLTENCPLSKLDITLIFRLFQFPVLCGLRPGDDPVWNSSDSLEYCIHAIKERRNELAHDDIEMTPEDLVAKLEGLETLLRKTIEKARIAFNVESSTVSSFLQSITTQLEAIREAPVPVATKEEYELEMRASIKSQVMEEGGTESVEMCSRTCQLRVASWLMSGRAVDPTLVYANPTIKRDHNQIQQRQLSVSESQVEVCDILRTGQCDGKRPQVILLSALSGMGKSSTIKYILSIVQNDRNDSIKGTEDCDLILYLACRDCVFSSVEQLVALLLPRTATRFQPDQLKFALLSLDLLIVLDDLNELPDTSLCLLVEFLKTVSQGTRLLATVSREKASSIERMFTPQHITLLLDIEGIPEEQTFTFLQRTLQHCIVPQSTITRGNNDLQGLLGLVTSLRPHLQDHLRSPEILSLLALSWTHTLDPINTSSTVTEIFMLVEDLLIHKVLLNLPGFKLLGISSHHTVSSKIDRFLLALSGVAMECIKRGKYSVEVKDIEYLTQTCIDLDLPQDYMISAFLNYTYEDNNNGMGVVATASPRQSVSFPRTSTLHFYASWFVLQHLKDDDVSPSNTIKNIMGLKQQESSTLTETQISSFRYVMKYLVGMLALKLPSQLKMRTKEIIAFLKELGVSRASHWLEYIEEVKVEPTLTHLLIMEEMGTVWEVENSAISLTFLDILRRRKIPDHLTISTGLSWVPSNFPHLKEVLEVCKTSKGMKLSLHLYQHYWLEKEQVSDDLLNILTRGEGGGVCQLESFAGRLSGSCIINLPTTHLTTLALQVDMAMLTSLNTVLPRLHHLYKLCLNLDFSPETVEPEHVPHLCINNAITSLSVDIWKVSAVSVGWACDVAQALSKVYDHLALRRSELTAHACSRWWVSGLQMRGVTAASLVIGSIRHATDKQQKRLLRDAKVIGCKKVEWIEV